MLGQPPRALRAAVVAGVGEAHGAQGAGGQGAATPCGAGSGGAGSGGGGAGVAGAPGAPGACSPSAAAPAAGTGGSGSGSGGSSGSISSLMRGPWQAVHDVARLRAQLALSLREQHAARDALVEAQQVGGARTSACDSSALALTHAGPRNITCPLLNTLC